MTARIIPIGAYQRIQEVRTPRTSREAFGKDVEYEKSDGLPRPLWHEWVGGAFLFLVIVVGIVMVAR